MTELNERGREVAEFHKRSFQETSSQTTELDSEARKQEQEKVKRGGELDANVCNLVYPMHEAQRDYLEKVIDELNRQINDQKIELEKNKRTLRLEILLNFP